ncbi:OsmC family protein [Myxococcota bacterium]|nr:OsmC family protein [Myxococcota bacterium]
MSREVHVHTTAGLQVFARDGRHQWTSDEPKEVSGTDTGPDPYALLLSSLGACTAMTVRLYADRKGWPLREVEVFLAHSREHRTDCEGCDEKPMKLSALTRRLRFHGPLDDDQVRRLLEIAGRCPVARTLEGHIEIRDSLEP